MYEIELKAHVYDRDALIRKITSFAEYVHSADKKDTYFHMHTDRNANGYISVRIRREIIKTSNEMKTVVFLTYKQKQIKTGKAADGAAIEVNDEKECVLSAAEPIEAILTDVGFTEALTKHKITECYRVRTDYGEALLELCNVPPLGDFIEIEILRESEENTDKIQKELETLLQKCGIPAENIEPRYYSEMLKERA